MRKIMGLLFAFILIFTGCGSSKIGDEVTAEDLIESEEWNRTAEEDGYSDFEYINPTNGVTLTASTYEEGGIITLNIDDPDIYESELTFRSNTIDKDTFAVKDLIYITNPEETMYANLTDEELESMNEYYKEEDAHKSVELTREDFDVEQFLKDQNMYNAFIDAINYIGYSDFTFDAYYQ